MSSRRSLGYSKTPSRVRPALILAFAVVSFGASAAAPKGISTSIPAAAQTTVQTIVSGGPLRSLFLGNELSAQIAHVSDSLYEVYPPSTVPADFGTLLVVGDTLYAPDFAGHGTTATVNLGTYTAFSPQGQSGVTGSGSQTDPYKVTTIARAGTTGLTITQVDSYVAGLESYRTDITVANSGTSSVSGILYRALDCYLGGSDSGYGEVSGNTVACKASPTSSSPGRIQQFVPLTGGSRYYEAGYSQLWSAIGSHRTFDGTCRCNENIDNAMGLSWNVTVPPGASLTHSHLTLLTAGSITSCGTTPVSVGISPLTSAINQNILFTSRAGIHAPFGGTMNFTVGGDDAAIVCSATVWDVSASCVHTLAPGSYSVIARYSGDAYNAPGCSPPQSITVVNSEADILTTIAIQAESLAASQGQPFDLKAQVTHSMGLLDTSSTAAAIDGFVTFSYGDNILADIPLDAAGVAGFTAVFPGGAYPITATYSGDAQNVASAQTAIVDVAVPADGLFYSGFDLGLPPQ